MEEISAGPVRHSPAPGRRTMEKEVNRGKRRMWSLAVGTERLQGLGLRG